jgi:hypothetical protein
MIGGSNMPLIVQILDRKFFEERLAAHYWAQNEAVQVGFLRAYNRPIPDTSAGRRSAISAAIATMDDGELRALVQAVISETAGPAA